MSTININDKAEISVVCLEDYYYYDLNSEEAKKYDNPLLFNKDKIYFCSPSDYKEMVLIYSKKNGKIVKYMLIDGSRYKLFFEETTPVYIDAMPEKMVGFG